MRPYRRRTKKLLIAFHFQFSSPAAWRCDTCRESGLVKIRNCAWLKSDAPPQRVVWARGRIISKQCPKSVTTGQSLRFLEIFQTWRGLGKGFDLQLNARDAEAIQLLEREWMAEEKHGG